MALMKTLRRIALRPFDRSDQLSAEARTVENPDAMAAAAGDAGRLDPTSGTGHANFPPNYVKTDDGRPRH